jgi:hypothetical protein
MDRRDEPGSSSDQIAFLREKWEEAKAKNGPYFPAEEVFGRIKARYQAMINEDKE